MCFVGGCAVLAHNNPFSVRYWNEIQRLRRLVHEKPVDTLPAAAKGGGKREQKSTGAANKGAGGAAWGSPRRGGGGGHDVLEAVVAAQHEELEAALLEIARLREENSALKTEVGVRRAQQRVSEKAHAKRRDPVKRAVDATVELLEGKAAGAEFDDGVPDGGGEV